MNAQDGSGSAGIREFLDELDATYSRLHTAKEDAFWVAKMGLGDDSARSQAEQDEREIELQRLLRDESLLRRARELLPRATAEEERLRLTGWLAMFEANAIESAEARALAEELVQDEGRLEHARGEMPLGYVDGAGGFVRASSVELGSMLQAEPDEARRRAAWEGLRSIEHFVLERGFLEIVRKRNRLGRLLGADDYYDWKTRRSERMKKVEVFALLDELEQRTREAARRAVDQAKRQYGAERFTPWSVAYLLSGDITRESDPYFSFRSAVGTWGRSFAGLGIGYANAELVLDLLDREGKYENGFMHGPVVAWRRHGRRIPARIHFTANALPSMVGSGKRALQTLFHEGGHAAHFANVDMPSPCFGQEFAPTSTAFAETQSMFCDSLLNDADWQQRYALDAGGKSLPLALIERGIDAHQPFAAWHLRALLAVCYAERAIYEIPDSELDAERVLQTLREVERRFLFLEQGSSRPVLSVPHLLSGEFSASYHGYVLALMAVHQTRAYFLERDGHLVDNGRIGPELAREWWQPGNSASFMDFVQRLTGKPLSAEHLASHVSAAAEQCKLESRAAIAKLADIPPYEGAVALQAKLRVVHGRELVAELGDDFAAFSAAFAAWIDRRASS